MKRLFCLLLIAIAVGPLFASGQQGAEATGNNVVAPHMNAYGWMVDSKPLEFSYFDARDSYNPDKVARNLKMIDDLLKNEFNVIIHKTVVELNPNEKLNMMLAALDYPDVIVGLDGASRPKWQEQGRIIDVTPYVDAVGSNIKSVVGDMYGFHLDDKGKLWAIPNGFGLDPYPYYTPCYRLDLYKEMGSPAIKTPDDYYQFLKALVAKYPVNSKGEKTYAMSWHNGIVLDRVAGFWGLKEGYKDDANHNLTHWLNTREGLDMVKYFNRFYREGLLDPDSFINKFEDWGIKMNNQRVFGHVGAWYEVMFDVGHTVWQKTLPDWKEDMRFICFTMKAPGAEAAYTAPKNSLGWDGKTVITDKCKNPKDVVRFIDFTCTPMGLRLVSWGVPNRPDSLWMMDGNNKWHFNDAQRANIIGGSYNKELGDQFGGEQLFFAIPMSPFPDDGKSVCWIEQNFPEADKWMAQLFEYTKSTIFDNTARTVVFAPDNPMLVVKTRLADAVATGFAKAVMSKTEAQCEANFNELRDAMNAVGLHDLERYLTENYKAKLKLMHR